MTAITTHPAMTGSIAAHAGEGRAQQGASGMQANAVPFSDMVHMPKPLTQPPTDKRDKDREAVNPETDMAEVTSRDEVMVGSEPEDPSGTGHLEVPPALDPEEATDIAPVAAPETRQAFPLALNAGDTSILSGTRQEIAMASRTERASNPSSDQRADGQVIPMAPEPEMVSDRRAMRTTRLPHHDFHPSAQIASPVRPIAESGIGLAAHETTYEHIPAAGAELEPAYKVGAGSLLSSALELSQAPRPAFAPSATAATVAFRPETGLDARDQTARTDPVAELSGPSGFEVVAREARPFGPLVARYGPDLPQHVARQIAEFAPGPQQATEVRLNPEELGRVRMTMVQSEGAISVAITAERGETLDLMRRHIGILAEEFRQIGYGSIQFDFGPDGRNRGSGQPPPGDDPTRADAGTTPGADDQEAPPVSILSVRAADGSIDIRL